MNLKPLNSNAWLASAFALAFALGWLAGGPTPAAFFGTAVGGIGLFLRILNRRLLSVFPRRGSLPFDHLPQRLWRVFYEVLLQYKVIRDRPLVGLLHAAVLWGFFAFAGASALHLSLGLRGLDKATENRGWYGAFAAAWAVAVLVGMIGLSFRRFVFRPKALGKLSPTSGVVAFLISLLMVTYVLGWRFLPVGSTEWKVNWWMHTSAFFLLLVVIPLSKHLHLILGPVAIFFRSENTSTMRALRDDGEDLGMIRFGDLERKDVLDVDACVECGRCTDTCPANLSGGTLSPKHIILDMREGLLSGGDLVAGAAAEKAEGKVAVAEEDLYQCFSCGACEYVCPVGIEHVGRKILDLRRGLVSEGRVSSEKVGQLFLTMERAPHNPWGIAHDARQRLIESKRFPIFDGTQEWLFWLGCGASYDPHGQVVAQAMQQILDAAHASWGVLPRETCCGEPARRAGNEYLFMELAGKLTETLASAGVKKLVTCCPHCTTMLDKDYRQMAAYAELGVQVMHHSELLAELMPRLPLKPFGAKTTYHDPCYLARGRGVTAPPREVLRAAGVAVVEPEHHGQNTRCCGAGGAQLFIADDQREHGQKRVNQLRIAELLETKAPTVAVACPYCPIMLRDAANAAQRDDLEILDIAEIVARGLTGSSADLRG